MTPETLKRLEELNDKWANEPFWRAKEKEELTDEVMDHLPDLIAAARERFSLIASQQICVGAAGVGDFSELCGWIDKVKQERDAAQKALKHLEGEIDATLVGFGDTVRVREDGGLEDLSASVALSMAKLNHKLKSAQKACAFWIRMAKQCATGTGPNGEYMTADDKCAAIDAAEMAGYADCGNGYHHEREIEPLVEALRYTAYQRLPLGNTVIETLPEHWEAKVCAALAQWEKEGK